MTEPTAELPKAVIAAMRHVLRPLVRLLIRQGITLPAMVELLKQVLVDVAIKDFPVEGKRTTDSRISVLTGVHRKDVKRLREVDAVKTDIPKRVSLGMQLVNTWMTDPDWLDEQGRPLILPRQAEGRRPSFEVLADRISSNDVRARAILDELLRLEVVEVRNGTVRLLTEAFVPKQGEAEKLYYFEQSCYAHLMAGVCNLEGRQPPFFDRVVQYHSIPASELPRLRRMLYEHGMALLTEINKAAKKINDPAADERHSLMVGLYFYNEAAENEG